MMRKSVYIYIHTVYEAKVASGHFEQRCFKNDRLQILFEAPLPVCMSSQLRTL